MRPLITIIGAVLVGVALRDIFHTLWHPSGRGSLSHAVMRMVWRVGRRVRRPSAAIGPLALVSVVGTWSALIVVGWTLVYWPHMPDSFILGPGLQASDRWDLLDSAYLSLVTVGTLGFGDIVPQAAWLRLVTPFQALVGFALLTAAVSWILQIYPALGRRRTLAAQLALLRHTDAATRLSAIASSHAAQILTEVMGGLVRLRVDVAQYAETYYFHDADPRLSLAATINYVPELIEAGRTSSRENVHLAADTLEAALEDFSTTLRDLYFHNADTVDGVLASFATDHEHTP